MFKSDAEARIAAVPVIEVHGTVARCDGGGRALGPLSLMSPGLTLPSLKGGGPMGHPVEFIQLNNRRDGPAT